jgi:FMN-dependent NADH-azoreductase
MSAVLVLNSSATGPASVTRALVQDAVSRLRAQDPDLTVVTRDLGDAPVPHLDADGAAGIGPAEPGNEAQTRTRTLSDTLIGELREADTLVLGAPMYNFGIPSTLKAWFDHVLRAGVTFRYSEAGPEGLMTGKRAIVVVARGGLYSEGPAQAMDFQEPHLRTMLGFIGITDVTFVRAERLAFGPESREQSIGAAQVELDRVAGTLSRAA